MRGLVRECSGCFFPLSCLKGPQNGHFYVLSANSLRFMIASIVVVLADQPLWNSFSLF